MYQSLPSVSLPAPAMQGTVETHQGGECSNSGSFFADSARQTKAVTLQVMAAFVAGGLGIVAIILDFVAIAQENKRCETFERSDCVDYHDLPWILTSPGVIGGIWCILQAVWAGFILANVRKMTKMDFQRQSSRRSSTARSLLCNVSAFATLNAISTAGLAAAGILFFTLFYNSGGDWFTNSEGAIVLCMCVACFVATVAGSCAVCKAGCGCTCCDYPTDTQGGYQPVYGTPAVSRQASVPNYGLSSVANQHLQSIRSET